jgi:soluble lytic murein transglycosylase
MKLYLLLAGLAASFTLFAQEGNDAAFLAARDAARTGNLERLDRAISELGSHPLSQAAEAYRQRILIEREGGTSLPAFLERNEGSLSAERLRADWIRWLGKRSSWNEIETQFPKMQAPEPDVSCYAQQARWAHGDRAVLDEAAKQWLTQLEPPESCRAVLDILVLSGRVTVDDVWTRARRQLEINRPAAARQTLNQLPDSQMPDLQGFDLAIKSAPVYLTRLSANWAASRPGRELVAIAIQRAAMNDPAFAAGELERRQGQMQAGEKQWAWSQVALQAAKRHMTEAVAWYEQAGKAPMSDEGHQWKVRAALRAQDWGMVRDAILAMPPELASRPEWIYWLGRAWKAGGKTTEADALFNRIAGQANFYGNLADEELGRRIMPPAKANPPTPEEVKAARENPSLRRALAYYRLDMRTEGVREWNWALRNMSDRELLAAADLARSNQIWDRAINTADRTKNEHDYSLRFLAPYGDQVRPAARNQSLDDAWVYGLMRQESRFVTSAKSNVGASGLMQLMPATAKWVAKKIGLRDYTHSRVTDTETNVLLGTSYMRLVMENLDNHPVLASAAYNAGPGRARKWRADKPLEGAIYAETIPFSETRDYVKKVMSNAVYYSALFTGKADSLKARLGTVGPRTNDATKDTDLP